MAQTPLFGSQIQKVLRAGDSFAFDGPADGMCGCQGLGPEPLSVFCNDLNDEVKFSKS